jgi:DNA gyrase subunit A
MLYSLVELLSYPDGSVLVLVRSVIVITKSGYVKRVPIDEFEAQSRGGRGKAGAKLSNQDDLVAHFMACMDHDTILFFSNGYVAISFAHVLDAISLLVYNRRGVAYKIKAYEIPLATRTAKGTPLPQLLPLSIGDAVATILKIDNSDESKNLMLITSHGTVKKTSIKSFDKISSRGLRVLTLRDGDQLRWAKICDDKEEHLVIATK